MSLELINIIFGMKVRQARNEAGLSLSGFARQADLSPSYVTEIEKGKKYPRADKIMKMAEVLNKDYDDLVSIKLPTSLAHLETTLSSSAFRRFPYEEFGLEASDLVNLLTRKPDKASALIHGILEIGRRFAVDEETFLRAALRSYQEIHENYFQELEDAAQQFMADFSANYDFDTLPLPMETLTAILEKEYDYQIDQSKMEELAPLTKYRSVFFAGKRPILLLNPKLYKRQIKFVLAREIGYQYLKLQERSRTSTPDRIDTFQQILNDFKAAYFGGALLMPRQSMIDDLQHFFEQPQWDKQLLQQMLDKYKVTPEMLLYRFSELIPEFFGFKLHFLRFHQNGPVPTYRLIKQLNMNQLSVPTGIGLHEHFCRRWLSVRLLDDMPRSSDRELFKRPFIGVQMSEFVRSKNRFLCIGFSRSLSLSDNIDSSVIVGFRVDSNLKSAVRWIDDPQVPFYLINETCERCELAADQCQLRAADPTILRAEEAARQRNLALMQVQTQLKGK